jgi:hypothetical protein
MLRERTAGGSLTLEIEQSFEPEDAVRIHELIERAAPGTPVEIDFRQVRECQDFALVALAKDLVAMRDRVAVRGMSKHQQRLLGYFGVSGAEQASGQPKIH